MVVEPLNPGFPNKSSMKRPCLSRKSMENGETKLAWPQENRKNDGTYLVCPNKIPWKNGGTNLALLRKKHRTTGLTKTDVSEEN
jgi:hypothetical protein